MPLMYHKDSKEPVKVADGCVDTMLNRGWSLDKPVEKQVYKTFEDENDLDEEK